MQDAITHYSTDDAYSGNPEDLQDRLNRAKVENDKEAERRSKQGVLNMHPDKAMNLWLHGELI